MTRRRVLLAVAVVVVGAAAAGLVAARDDPVPRLAGAELLADGGDAEIWRLRNRPIEDIVLDDIPIEDTYSLGPGAEGSIVLLSLRESVVMHARGSGEIEAITTIAPIGRRFFLGRNGSLGAITRRRGSSPQARGSQVQISEPFLGPIWSLDAAFEASALAFGEGGTMLVGGRDDARIDVYDIEGRARGDRVGRLLGPPEDGEAAVHWKEPPGGIVALVQLPDGRVVFIADADEGERLFLLDDETVRPIEGGPDLVSVVAGTYDPELSPLTAPLSPAGDGRVLAVGMAADGAPRISVVDVDSGEVEVVADLDGVRPTLRRPVSAAAVGEDLVFLAEGKLWRKQGVL